MDTQIIIPVQLRCEHQENPPLIDCLKPCLSWQVQCLDSSSRNVSQTAYRILVASSEEILNDDRGDLWDSGKIESDQSIGVPYAGKRLVSRQRCFWKVQIWDEHARRSTWSKNGFWFMSLLEETDWQAQWISAPKAGFSAPCLRKEWTIHKKIVRAVAYFCGLGFGELFLNGRKVGNEVLSPCFTDYSQRVLYVRYDVTDYLTSGENAVGILLGNGWFWLPTPDQWGFHKAPWRNFPRALLQLELEYGDGSRELLATDKSWKWALSPIVFNCLRAGEVIDQREEQPGWNKAGFDDTDWKSVSLASAPEGRLTAQHCPPVRIIRELKPVKLTQPKPGVFVYDFGTYISGWPRYVKHQKHDGKVTITCSEKCDADGTLCLRGNDMYTFGAYQTLYAVGKEGRYEPRFTYHGFRYVQIEYGSCTGASEVDDRFDAQADEVVAIEVRADLHPAGDFKSSDPVLNAVHCLLLNGAAENLIGIGTDCPAREKVGWMYDGFVAMSATMHDYHVDAVCRKLINDILDAQGSSGLVPRYVPWPGDESRHSAETQGPIDPWWGSTIIQAPWMLYCQYGDVHLLRSIYPSMKRFVDYLLSFTQHGLYNNGYGDWLAGSACDMNDIKTLNRSLAPVPLVATAGLYHAVTLFTGIGKVLDKQDDISYYRQKSEEIRQAFIANFIGTDGRVVGDGDEQTGPALVLALGLAPIEHRRVIAQVGRWHQSARWPYAHRNYRFTLPAVCPDRKRVCRSCCQNDHRRGIPGICRHDSSGCDSGLGRLGWA